MSNVKPRRRRRLENAQSDTVRKARTLPIEESVEVYAEEKLEVTDDGPEIQDINPEPDDAHRGQIIFGSDPITTIMEKLEFGQAIVITRLAGDERYSMHVTTSDKISSTPGALTLREYFETVYTKEFLEWKDMWDSMHMEEKRAYAARVGAKWDEHTVGRIDSMRMAEAVRIKQGMKSKYKKEWNTRKKRAKIRPRLN
jgi:hypothetical protein